MPDLTDFMGYDRIFFYTEEDVGFWVEDQGNLEWIKLRIKRRPVVKICVPVYHYQDRHIEVIGSDVCLFFTATDRQTVIHVCANKLGVKVNKDARKVMYRVGGDWKEPVCWEVPYDHYADLAKRYGYQLIP